MSILKKILEVKKSVTYLKKENKGFQYNYVSSSQVLGNIRSKMNEVGLLIEPHVLQQEIKEFKDGKGKNQFMTILQMEFVIIDVDTGESRKVEFAGQGVDNSEKGLGKALTYAEKYFLLKYFNIPTDQLDPDAFQEKTEKTTKKTINRSEEIANICGDKVEFKNIVINTMKKYNAKNIDGLKDEVYEKMKEYILSKVKL